MPVIKKYMTNCMGDNKVLWEAFVNFHRGPKKWATEIDDFDSATALLSFYSDSSDNQSDTSSPVDDNDVRDIDSNAVDHEQSNE